MKSKTENLIILKKTTIQFPDLGILGKQIVWAQVSGQNKYYVWIEDETEGDDPESESISQVPLAEVNKYSPNICKNKSTAESVFNYYLEKLTEVSEHTVEYFHTKNPIPVA